MHKTTVGIFAAMAIFVAACGGSDDSTADPAVEEPAAEEPVESDPPVEEPPAEEPPAEEPPAEEPVETDPPVEEPPAEEPPAEEPVETDPPVEEPALVPVESSERADLGIDGNGTDRPLLATYPDPADFSERAPDIVLDVVNLEADAAMCGGRTPVTNHMLVYTDTDAGADPNALAVSAAAAVAETAESLSFDLGRITAVVDDEAGRNDVANLPAGPISVVRVEVEGLLADPGNAPYADPERVRELVQALNDAGLMAEPNGVIVFHQAFRYSPGGPPRAADEIDTDSAWAGAASRPVLVFDSSMPDETDGVTFAKAGFTDDGTKETYPKDPNDPSKFTGDVGHGPFIAALIGRLMATGDDSSVHLHGMTTIRSEPRMESAAFTVVQELLTAAASVEGFGTESAVNAIVNMSWGAFGCEEVPFESLRKVLEMYALSGAELVAAAGNESFDFEKVPDGDGIAKGAFSQPGIDDSIVQVPAAFDFVTSVGSLDATCGISGYSNRGPGVDKWVIGESIVSQYPQINGDSTGWAQWDGTSFAAAVYSAALATGRDASFADPVPEGSTADCPGN